MTTLVQTETPLSPDEAQDRTARGLVHWRATTGWRGCNRRGTRVTSFDRGDEVAARTFAVDVADSAEPCGRNAPTALQEHMIAALNARLAVGYVSLCAANGIRLRKVEIEIGGDADLSVLFGLNNGAELARGRLDCMVRLEGDASPEQFAKIHETVVATSADFRNLARRAALNLTLVVE